MCGKPYIYTFLMKKIAPVKNVTHQFYTHVILTHEDIYHKFNIQKELCYRVSENLSYD